MRVHRLSFIKIKFDPGLAPLFQETHQCVKDKVQGGPESPSCGCALEVRRGPRHTVDAVLGHCSLQAGLWLCRVWRSIKHQPATTGLHPQHWIKTGALSILHQPSLQFVCWDQWSSLEGTPAKAVHELLSQNTCLHWKSGTSCPARIRPNQQRSVCLQAKWARRYVPTPKRPVGLRVEAALVSAEISVDLICPLRQPSFPPGTQKYDPSRHIIEGVSKCMISREKTHAKINEYCGTLGPHDEVYTDGSKIEERVGAAAVINRHVQNGEITCRCLSKRLPDNSTSFAAEATAITLALDYYRHMEPVRHDVVVYSDSMSCLQAIEGEDTENPLICCIMNLLWLLSDKGTHVRLCWIPSHCGIEATAITLALNYYQNMGPVHHDVIDYSDSMSCLLAIEGEDTENPFICHIMNLLWLLNDKGTHIRFCWIPNHCGIDGNESWPAGEGDPWPWHRSSGGCPLCRS